MTGRPARAIMLLALAALPAGGGAAKAPPPPEGELVLDMAAPMMEVRIGDVPLRLRVALDQKRLIELNPDAAERLRADPPDRRFHFESGFDALVGRETLSGIQAAAPIRINGRKMLVTVASHGRPCCRGVDGEIGIGLLPYAKIRFVRQASAELSLPADRISEFTIDDNDEHGPQTSAAVGRQSVNIQFSFERPESVATASAGAILARAYGGRLSDGGRMVAAFGIERPIAMLHFRQPATVAGFEFRNLPVRTADFAGREQFPTDPDEPGDIVVRKKVSQQQAWPVVLIGRDRTDRCSEAIYDTIARRLTLRCAGMGN